jgi:hypothetical protein
MKVFARLVASFLVLISSRVAAIAVECDILADAQSRTLVIRQSGDPYETTSVEFENGFRFSAQVVGSPSRLKTFTYFDSRDRHVLIHTDSRSIGLEDSGRAMGENRIYSPRLELELLNSCRVVCGR